MDHEFDLDLTYITDRIIGECLMNQRKIRVWSFEILTLWCRILILRTCSSQLGKGVWCVGDTPRGGG